MVFLSAWIFLSPRSGQIEFDPAFSLTLQKSDIDSSLFSIPSLISGTLFQEIISLNRIKQSTVTAL